MNKIPKIFFDVWVLDSIKNSTISELKEAVAESSLGPLNNNEGMDILKSTDGDYLIPQPYLPSSTKKQLSLPKRFILRKFFKPVPDICSVLLVSIQALLEYAKLEGTILIIPDQFVEYRKIFRMVIPEIFEIIDERYDPDTGEAIIHVKRKFTTLDDCMIHMKEG